MEDNRESGPRRERLLTMKSLMVGDLSIYADIWTWKSNKLYSLKWVCREGNLIVKLRVNYGFREKELDIFS